MALKHELAHSIVSRVHDAAGADAAREAFRRIVQRKELPDDIPAVDVAIEGEGGIRLFELLVLAGLASSKSEARRLVQQGAVSVDRERVKDPLAPVSVGERLVQAGKRRFARVRLTESATS